MEKTYIWHTQCLIRDKFTCIKCGQSKTEKLIVHHIDESRKKGLKFMNNNLDNLETLCFQCHAERHGFTKRRRIYKEVMFPIWYDPSNPINNYKKRKINTPKQFSQRTLEIIELRDSGYSYRYLSKKYGVTIQRIQQIYSRHTNN